MLTATRNRAGSNLLSITTPPRRLRNSAMISTESRLRSGEEARTSSASSLRANSNASCYQVTSLNEPSARKLSRLTFISELVHCLSLNFGKSSKSCQTMKHTPTFFIFARFRRHILTIPLSSGRNLRRSFKIISGSILWSVLHSHGTSLLELIQVECASIPPISILCNIGRLAYKWLH